MYIGIDPGLKGAIATYNEETDILKIYPMPVKDGRINVEELDGLMYFISSESMHNKNCICVIEKSQAMPGQGSVSGFTIGYGYGVIIGLITSNGIPYTEVRPHTWKKHFSLSLGSKYSKKEKKAASIAKAKELYPGVSLKPSSRSRVDSDGLAEAVLIMHYGMNLTAS